MNTLSRSCSFAWVVGLLLALAAGQQAIADSDNNVVQNGGFESGTSGWSFFTNATGSFNVAGAGYGSANAAVVTTTTVEGNIQLFQAGVPLQPNTAYRLTFWALSNTGHDLRVSVQKHGSPYTIYGLNKAIANLGTGWQSFTFDFTTTGFSAPVTDARLMFWFASDAAPKDQFRIDNVSLTTTGGTGTGGGTGTSGKELLVYDLKYHSRSRIITASCDRGFPKQEAIPNASQCKDPMVPGSNGNWVSPTNYADGTLHLRAHVHKQPSAQSMRLQLCIWQYNLKLETCTKTAAVSGRPGTVVTWSQPISQMWKKNGTPIDWKNPRQRYGMAIKNSEGAPVSDYSGDNWNGEDPKKWYPLDMDFTVVVVPKGGTFSGWSNYPIKGPAK